MYEVRVAGVRVRLVRGDITEQAVDAVVNAANSTLLGGGGVDGAIHRRGGPDILAECRRLRAERYPEGLPTGQAVATTAGRLPARAVIHAVGPVWSGGGAGEADLLASAYRAALAAAAEGGWRTVAFPSISTGAYGYPVAAAAEVALGAVAGTLRDRPDSFDEVRMVLFSESDLDAYGKASKHMGGGRVGMVAGRRPASRLNPEEANVARNQDQDQERQRDPVADLEARIDAAIEEVRPKIRRALDELDSRVDAAVAELRPRVESAMQDVKPRVDRFIRDAQPGLDSALARIQARIGELRTDLEARAARGGSASENDEPGALPRPGEAGGPDEGKADPGSTGTESGAGGI